MKLDDKEMRELIAMHLGDALEAVEDADPASLIKTISRALDIADELNNEQNRKDN